MVSGRTSLFKERLFVYPSRFCEVRYCIIRHCAFLLGYGYSAGDPQAPVQTVDQVIRLLARPTPTLPKCSPANEKSPGIGARAKGL